ncbi:protein kinase [Candidatus Gracilibacteria bacterium]|nr:protein kinase [Candidatus Gracilibacteria bacterium]
MTDLVGRTIGDYRIEAFLGDGSIDQQFDARHIRLDRPVLLRLLDQRFGTGPDFSARFLNELRAVAALRAPHIVDIYDFGEQDGRCFIAQERATSTLRELLQQQAQARDPLAMLDLVGLIRHAADGLAAAHARGVVHGAIKPVSLYLQRDATPTLKVGDFGIARLAASFAAVDACCPARIYVAGASLERADRREQGHIFARRSTLGSLYRLCALRRAQLRRGAGAPYEQLAHTATSGTPTAAVRSRSGDYALPGTHCGRALCFYGRTL